ncbi:MAG: hypothetical protein ACYTAO_03520 [Planctomycetota bacterium]|jgi:hypothetical protein
MVLYTKKGGSTDVSVVIRIIDSTDGTPETGVVWNTAGIDMKYRREGAVNTSITEATLASLSTAHTDGGFLHIGNGYYRLDLPDAAVAAGAAGCLVHGVVTGMVVIGCYIEIVAYDPTDAVRLGLTAMPNAAADAAGGLPISDAGGLDLDALNTAAVRLTAARAQVLDDWINTGRLDAILDIIAADVVNLDGAAMRGTDNAALASVCTEGRLAELDAANLPANIDTILANTAATRLVDTTVQAGSTASLLVALAADLPGAGSDDADDDYNGAMVIAYDVNSGNRPNIRLVSDYDAATDTFTLDSALGFTPEVGVDTFEVWADPGAAILVEILKLSTGFGASSPDNLIGHLRAMMSKAASAPSGVGTYLPSTDSLEILGESAAAIRGAGFATGTDSLEAIRNAIDDLVTPLVITASGTLSGVGFLSECVSLIRKATDEPDTGPKYPDADLIEYIHSAFDQVLASINVETDHPILTRRDVSVVSGTRDYLLPCNVSEIWRIAKIDTNSGVPTWEVWPTNEYTFRGDGWTVEGNILRFHHLNLNAETLEILYIAGGDVSIHTATAGAGAASTITFPASPTDGSLDTRPDAYAGYTVRTLSGTGAGQERIVSAYDASTRVATVRPAWTTTPDNTTVYEVLPQYSRLIRHVVALYASLDVLGNETRSEARKEIELQLQRKMSALKLTLAKKVRRFGTQGPGVDTYDNTDIWPLLP